MIFHLKIQKQTPVTAESATLSSRFTSEDLIVMDSSRDIYSMLSLAKPQRGGGVKCKIVVKNPFSEQCRIFNACHHQRWTNTLILSAGQWITSPTSPAATLLVMSRRDPR